MTSIIRLPLNEQSQEKQNIAIDQLAEMIDSGRAGSREALTANRTYYVLTTGSDSNSGLVNTAGGAFLTIQHAIDIACTLDLGIYSVTIQVGSGTYNGQIVLKQFVGTGPIIIKGDVSTPANVALTATAPNDSVIYSEGLGTGSLWWVRGFHISSVTTGHLIHILGGIIQWDSIDFGLAAGGYNHLYFEGLSRARAMGNYSISGNAGYSVLVRGNSFIDTIGSTVTLTGTPAFSGAFVRMDTGAAYSAYSMVFSGAATGIRFQATQNSVLVVAGAGASYFPGNVAGSTSTGGQYL